MIGHLRQATRVAAILKADPVRWRILEVVGGLELPDCWIAAGFVRSAVWDALHGRSPRPPGGDVDVIWFDPSACDEAVDRRIERRLRSIDPSIDWSVKNQARMHQRNADAPYLGSTDAMRYWPETATAVAARRTEAGECEISAPYGLDDLFDLVVRPADRFRDAKRGIFEERVRSKAWLKEWPDLVLADN